ncbi:MAG: hypothetical protein HC860_07990 [Alkalinema sp. RU_4_3]|nr:hypothetical protein [Alkalinema sp. RU_4_3]
MVSPSPINDSFKQARQGSISAIIQVLNEKLAGRGIRTRAMVDNNILQLLCEADSAEDLERSRLVKAVQSVLEEVSPRHVRRVNINARIIQEQQLLWLDELKNDPDKQPLWSEEIKLTRPNLMRHLFEDMKGGSKGIGLPALGASNSRWKGDRKPTSKLPLWIGLGLIGLVGVGGVAYWMLPPDGDETASQNVIASPEKPKRDQALVDPFDRAVNLAGEASAEGTKASSPAQWKAIALKWKAASDLMGQVPSTHPRYELAQNRTKTYQANQVIAEKRSQ